nr:MAG TPA: hypothetical protein [Caudoviricetes sp.]
MLNFKYNKSTLIRMLVDFLLYINCLKFNILNVDFFRIHRIFFEKYFYLTDLS